MNKTLIACAVAAALAVATTGADAARGDGQSGARSGGNWSGNHGSWSGNHGSWSGNRGNWSGNRGNWSGGHNWSGNHGNWNGGRRWYGSRFGGYRNYGFGSVYLGWPWYWWGPSYYGYPAYSYYGYPASSYYDYPAYYDSTEVYVEPSGSAPPPAPQQNSQYYCPDSGYYPSVQACPRGWLRVLPGDPPPR